MPPFYQGEGYPLCTRRTTEYQMAHVCPFQILRVKEASSPVSRQPLRARKVHFAPVLQQVS